MTVGQPEVCKEQVAESDPQHIPTENLLQDDHKLNGEIDCTCKF